MHGQAFGSTRDNPVLGLLRSRTSPLADGRHPLKMGLRARISAMQGDVFDAPPISHCDKAPVGDLRVAGRLRGDSARNRYAASPSGLFALCPGRDMARRDPVFGHRSQVDPR